MLSQKVKTRVAGNKATRIYRWQKQYVLRFYPGAIIVPVVYHGPNKVKWTAPPGLKEKDVFLASAFIGIYTPTIDTRPGRIHGIFLRNQSAPTGSFVIDKDVERLYSLKDTGYEICLRNEIMRQQIKVVSIKIGNGDKTHVEFKG